jgi:hypothetical protein
MTEGLQRFYGGSDLHFLTFSCYRRRPLFRNEGLAHLYVLCKGGDDDVGGRPWKIPTQAVSVPTFAKTAKVGQPPQRWASRPPLAIEPQGAGHPAMQSVKQRFAQRVVPRRRQTRSASARPLQTAQGAGHPHPRSKAMPIWQPRFYDFNVWTEGKRIEKLSYMHQTGQDHASHPPQGSRFLALLGMTKDG